MSPACARPHHPLATLRDTRAASARKASRSSASAEISHARVRPVLRRCAAIGRAAVDALMCSTPHSPPTRDAETSVPVARRPRRSVHCTAPPSINASVQGICIEDMRADAARPTAPQSPAITPAAVPATVDAARYSASAAAATKSTTKTVRHNDLRTSTRNSDDVRIR